MRELSQSIKPVEVFLANFCNYLCCFITKASPRLCFVKRSER